MNELIKKLRIVYLGTPLISAKVLEQLILKNYNIIALVAQPNKEKNRKGILLDVPTKQVAEKYNIPVFQFEKIRDHVNEISNLKPDILLTMAYGQLIPTTILDITSLPPLNLHGSLLPQYRGAAPIQYSLINGDKVTGVTLMKMIKEMDAGTMYYKEVVSIDDDDNYTTLQNKISLAAVNAFEKGIKLIVEDSYQGEEQDENLVSFTSKISTDFEHINFNQDAIKIRNIIRALALTPGSYFYYKNEKIKVFSAKAVDLECDLPGRIISYTKDGLVIGAINGCISIQEIQKPGKKILNIKDFYNGLKDYFVPGEFVEW